MHLNKSLNKSTTHTNDEQGAWWQVDLGSRKKISKIIIYNRTDCCVDRLSNYQVTISNKAADAVWIYTGLCGRFSKR
jgi:hypothetical protein